MLAICEVSHKASHSFVCSKHTAYKRQGRSVSRSASDSSHLLFRVLFNNTVPLFPVQESQYIGLLNSCQAIKEDLQPEIDNHLIVCEQCRSKGRKVVTSRLAARGPIAPRKNSMSTATPHARIKSCPLLSPPPELRLHIYDFVLARDLQKIPVRPVRPRTYHGLYLSYPLIQNELRPLIVKELDAWMEHENTCDAHLSNLAAMYIGFLRDVLDYGHLVAWKPELSWE